MCRRSWVAARMCLRAWRWSIPFLLVACVESCLTGPSKPVRTEGPNIVLILVDDLRWDALGATGHAFAKTPSIDRITATGALFENAFVVQSLCSPSRASYFAGTYPQRHGVRDNDTKIPKTLLTIGQLLWDEGYDTGFFGKWHMGTRGEPQPGWDWWAGFDTPTYFDPVFNVNGQTRNVKGHITDAVTDYAVDFIASDRSAPFFAVISHQAVHLPSIAQPQYQGLFDAVPIEAGLTLDTDLTGKLPALSRFQAVRSVQQLADLIRRYHEALTGLDASIGRVLEALEQGGVLDNTLLIVASDNGFFLGEHGFLDKRLAYEESMRIPLIVRYPSWFEPGTRFDPLVLNIDVAPTILEAAAVDGPSQFQGISLRAAASGAHTRTSFVYEYVVDPQLPAVPAHRALRTESYKFIRWSLQPTFDELYELREDPFERHNLAWEPAYQTVVTQLREELERRYRQAVGN